MDVADVAKQHLDPGLELADAAVDVHHRRLGLRC